MKNKQTQQANFMTVWYLAVIRRRLLQFGHRKLGANRRQKGDREIFCLYIQILLPNYTVSATNDCYQTFIKLARKRS